MIQPNLPIPLAFYYLSHFLTLLFLSSSRVAPWLPSPPLSLLYPSACFAISASLHFALSSPPSLSPSRSPSPSSFHSRSIFPFYFYHPLSIRHRPRGRERLRGRRAPGCDATHRDCRRHHGRKPSACPFASDQHNSDL